MNKNIHVFSSKEHTKSDAIMTAIGLRGQQAMEFAELNLPILPGFIIDSGLAAHLESLKLTAELKPYFVVQLVEGKHVADPFQRYLELSMRILEESGR